MALPTIVLAMNDAETTARLEAAVEQRYSGPLYERVENAGPETVEVFLHLGPDAPLWVADAPKHAALSQSLWEEFGAAAMSEFRERDKLCLPFENLHLKVNADAQRELFESDLDELPELIAGFFPIVDPKSGYRLVLDDVQPEPILNPYTSAWCLDASFRLIDDSGAKTLDEFEHYGFGRFWEPGENGRGKEGYGIPLGKPYDEVALLMRRFLIKWCSQELPESLSRCIAAKKLTVQEILE